MDPLVKPTTVQSSKKENLNLVFTPKPYQMNFLFVIFEHRPEDPLIYKNPFWKRKRIDTRVKPEYEERSSFNFFNADKNG